MLSNRRDYAWSTVVGVVVDTQTWNLEEVPALKNCKIVGFMRQDICCLTQRPQQVWLLEFDGRMLRKRISLPPNVMAFKSLVFSPDCSMLAFWVRRSPYKRDLVVQDSSRAIEHTLFQLDGAPEGAAIGVSHSNQLVAFSCSVGMVVFDLHTYKIAWQADVAHVSSIAFSPSDRYVTAFSISSLSTVAHLNVWLADTGQLVYSQSYPFAVTACVTADGSLWVVTSRFGKREHYQLNDLQP